MKKLLLVLSLAVLSQPVFAKDPKWAREMSEKEFQKTAASINAATAQTEEFLLEVAQNVGIDHPVLPFYFPIQETYRSYDHSAGSIYARHLKPEVRDWIETKLKPAVSETGAILILENHRFVLRNNDAEKAQISTGDLIAMKAHPPTDPEPGDFVESDNSKPDFSHLFGDVKLAHAIKDKLNDPDSYRTVSVGDPYPDSFNGFPCFTVIVKFSARNAFNATIQNSAHLSVMKMGGSWEVVKCEIDS